MIIVFTKHAQRKQEILRELGWDIDLTLVETAIRNPDRLGQTKQKQATAIKYLDQTHFLRVIYKTDGAIIRVITFHVAKKGRYAT